MYISPSIMSYDITEYIALDKTFFFFFNQRSIYINRLSVHESLCSSLNIKITLEGTVGINP